MSLFPSCSFQVEVPSGRIVPGDRLEAVLVVTAAEPVPRAEHIDLVFESVAWAGYGSGKSRSVKRRKMFEAPLRLDLPKGQPLAAGTHRYPFVVDLPPWLPPGYVGDDCAIEHTIRTHLDVRWAVDPKSELTPTITPRPREATRTGIIVRSPPGFHDEIVLEVTLESTVIVANEPIRGQIAIRSGRAAGFNGVELTIASTAIIMMAQHDRRHLERSKVYVPAAKLRNGDAFPFQFAPIAGLPPRFRTSFIDHDVVLLVSLDLPWARDPRFSIALDVLPQGSTAHGAGVTNIVGSERLRRLGMAMAQSTGLQLGARSPVLVQGKIGCVSLAVLDAPRAATLGVDLDITFPDVELGIDFHAKGLLDGFRDSPLLPPQLEGYFLGFDLDDARPNPSDESLRAFVAAVLAQVTQTTEIRLSDHHLAAHVAIGTDDGARMVDIARTAAFQAKQIGDAIAALPFPAPLAAARPAWEATAREQNAMLVPTGPTLHGVLLQARVADGQERSAAITLRTIWTSATPAFRAEVDLAAVPIPESARKQLETDATLPALVSVRACFEIVHVAEDGSSAILEHAGWPEDPRTMLPALEVFFAWVLDVRGERRVDAPYR